MKPDPDKNFIDQIKRALDQGDEQLPQETEARLRQIRQRALQEQKHSPLRRRFLIPTPVLAAAATACLLAVVFFKIPSGNSPLTPIEDLDLLASNDQLELYEELEFYTWLAEDIDAG